MRTSVIGIGLVALTVGATAQAAGQGLTFDARRIGMGGLSLGRSASLMRYNAAYGAVPEAADRRGRPRVTIPIPLGIIQFLHDHPHLSTDPAFHPDSAGFNPILVANTLLNPGFGIKGVRVSVLGWLHYDLGVQLNDNLLAFLRDSIEAQARTGYGVFGNGIVEGGFAPTVSYAGRVAGDSSTGLYVGGALHYYLGAAYVRSSIGAGFATGDSIFTGPNPVTPRDSGLTSYSKPGNALGHGVGGDVGVAWISGPIELGIGVNDIGATLTWSDTRQDSVFYRDSTFSKPVANHVSTTTKLPVSYVANVTYTIGKTTLGADVLNTGRGATVHVGGEQRLGLIALRGGIARDQRKRIEFGWGGGVRLGPLGLDVGFWTHTNSLSNERGVTMATSFSIY